MRNSTDQNFIGKKNRWKTLMVLGTVAAACVAADVGDVLYVKWITLPIRNGKFAFSKIVATAPKGDQISVLSVDSSKWLKVRYFPHAADASQVLTPVEGYVYEDSLDSSEVSAAEKAATTQSVQAGTAGASRGLLDSGKYANEKGLSEDPFKKMIQDADDVTKNNPKFADEFELFTKTASIGPHKAVVAQ